MFSPRRLLIALTVVLLTGVLFLVIQRSNNPPLDLHHLADNIIKRCASGTYHPFCYEAEIPKLMDSPYNLSMLDTFQVVKDVQTSDKSYGSCHTLGHLIGAKAVYKDPQDWQKVASECPVDVCDYGCVHGSFQAKFQKDQVNQNEIKTVLPELKQLCRAGNNWTLTSYQQLQCFHGLGHLAMYITNGDVGESLAVCRQITSSQSAESICDGGVFMIVFDPLEQQDLTLISGRQPPVDQVDSFCQSFNPDQKNVCLIESWHYHKDELSKAPQKVVDFCNQIDIPKKQECENVIFNIMFSKLQFSSQMVTAYCSKISDNTLQGVCLGQGVIDLLQPQPDDPASIIGLCAKGSNEQSKSTCLKDISFNKFGLVPGTSYYLKTCQAMPENMRSNCQS